MELNVNNIDINKTDLGLRHNYEPNTRWNKSLDEVERVSMECEYFKVGEKMKYATVSSDLGAGLDFPRIFKEKVKRINNLSINGKEITTSERFLKFPAVPELEALMMDVVLHIISSDSLNKEEEKN